MDLKMTFKFSNCERVTKMPSTKSVLFAWKLKADAEKIPDVDVVLYRSTDIYTDKFKILEKRTRGDVDMAGLAIFRLALAQTWTDSTINNTILQEAKMMRQILLKPGSYHYLYRVDGTLRLHPDDKITLLASKRKVHYVDVQRRDGDVQCYADVDDLRPLDPSIPASNDITKSIDILRSFSSMQELYGLNLRITGGRMSPLERAVWQRVEKEMKARLRLRPARDDK